MIGPVVMTSDMLMSSGNAVALYPAGLFARQIMSNPRSASRGLAVRHCARYRFRNGGTTDIQAGEFRFSRRLADVRGAQFKRVDLARMGPFASRSILWRTAPTFSTPSLNRSRSSQSGGASLQTLCAHHYDHYDSCSRSPTRWAALAGTSPLEREQHGAELLHEWEKTADTRGSAAA